MNWDEQTYKDRFGNDWTIQMESTRGKPKRVSFTCDEFLLVAVEDETEAPTESTSERVKELFCAAERVVTHEEEKWYVGFRTRTGRGGRSQGGVQTRFRSESGEVRYAKRMLQFRHMPRAELCEQLAAAKATVRTPA
jgi:hypothetical protein